MTAIATHLLCLESGARFTARPIRPDDKPALSAFFERLSLESRRRRFLGPKPRLTSRDLAFLTEVDQCTHVALAAVDADGAIVAVARYNAWRDRPGHAELAVAVADDWHGRGLGSALSEALLAHARRTSVVALTGSTLSENAPARALLRRLGFKRVGVSAGVSEYVLALRGGAALPAAA
jgi:RimJ/RimL family protein N-acetyltransferase